jgi:hypothetical protein
VCGPILAWDLIVIDVSYVLVLVGGAMVLRARSSAPVTWAAFGLLSAAVGAYLFFETYAIQTALAAPGATAAIDALKAC